jgi:hypothetical protein
MVRRLAPVLALAATCLALACAATAQASDPALVLTPKCSKLDDGTQVYGATFGVTGFAPNSDVTGSLDIAPINPDGSLAPAGGFEATVTADANGNYVNQMGIQGQPAAFTLTIDNFPGGSQSKSIRVTCDPPQQRAKPHPTRVRQCRHGGFKRFGFKTSRRCVAYVKRSARTR